MPITIDGKTYTVPDVYGNVEVVNLGSAAIPAFNGLLMIFSAKQGIPYNATGKKGYELIKAFSDIPSVKAEYGVGEASEAFAQAKKGGAGVVYMLNAASLTRAKATVKDNAGTPVTTFDIEPRIYGAVGNDISFKLEQVSSNTVVTILPPKLTKFLTANASASNPEISVNNVEGLAVGNTVYLCSNSYTTPQQTTIAAIDAVNNKITLAANPASAVTTADYARIFQEDVDNQEVGTFVTSGLTVQAIIAWINTGKILTATRGSYTGVVPTATSKTYIQAFASATKGTSPDATTTTGGDYDLVAEKLPLLFEEFTNYTKARIRIINVITPVAGVHTSYKTIAISLRNINYSIINVFGCAVGDINLATSEAAYPIKRAQALNSDDCILVGSGIDGKAAYLSSAPQFAGWLSGNTVRKNTTWDSIQASSVEKFFGESNRDTALKLFVDSGVIVFRTTEDGFYVAQGLTTYQDHSMIWNSSEKKTYLIMQRQIVDFVEEGYRKQMKIALKDDNLTVAGAVNMGETILKKYAAEGFIEEDFTVTGYQEGNAIITEPIFRPINSNDFVGYKMKVIIKN